MRFKTGFGFAQSAKISRAPICAKATAGSAILGSEANWGDQRRGARSTRVTKASQVRNLRRTIRGRDHWGTKIAQAPAGRAEVGCRPLVEKISSRRSWRISRGLPSNRGTAPHEADFRDSWIAKWLPKPTCEAQVKSLMNRRQRPCQNGQVRQQHRGINGFDRGGCRCYRSALFRRGLAPGSSMSTWMSRLARGLGSSRSAEESSFGVHREAYLPAPQSSP